MLEHPEFIPSPSANEDIGLGLNPSVIYTLGGAGLEVIQIAFGPGLLPRLKRSNVIGTWPYVPRRGHESLK